MYVYPILPTVHGEKAVLRLLGSGDKELNLSNLGFPDNKLSKFKNGSINHME